MDIRISMNVVDFFIYFFPGNLFQLRTDIYDFSDINDLDHRIRLDILGFFLYCHFHTSQMKFVQSGLLFFYFF